MTRLVGLRGLVATVRGDAQRLPFVSGSFDACISQEAFLHIPDKAAVLAGCHRVLRGGGRLAFTDWIAHPRLDDRERDRLHDWMAATTLQTLEGYGRLVGRAGFAWCEAEDLTAEWRAILRHRLAAFPDLVTVKTFEPDSDVHQDLRVIHLGRFEPVLSVRRPYAYVLGPGLDRVAENLRTHGIRLETFSGDALVEAYTVTGIARAEQPFQGHQERTLFGAYETVTENVAAGTMVVSLEQPLGRLAFMLLEPRSDDGFTNWNVLDGPLGIAITAPPRGGGGGGGGGGGRGRGAGAAPVQRATHYPILRPDEVLR